MFEKLTKQLRQTFFFRFFSSYTIYFILLINCINTVVLTEQSLHHNIILEKLDHCCVNRICTKIVISDSHTTSLLIYNEKITSIYLLIHFLSFSKFFFLSFNFIFYIKLKSIYLLILFSLFQLHILYKVVVKLFADSFSYIHLLHFFFASTSYSISS